MPVNKYGKHISQAEWLAENQPTKTEEAVEAVESEAVVKPKRATKRSTKAAKAAIAEATGVVVDTLTGDKE